MTLWKGWDARLDRAQEHLRELEAEANASVQRYKNSITHTFDPERGLYIYSFGQWVPGYRLGVLVGDVAHALRAALNHLAYALAPSEFIAFPIFDEAGPKCSSALREFPQKFRAELRRWQPYNAGKGAHDHSLWIVHRLDVIEKHQCVPVSPARISTGRPSFIGHDQNRDPVLAVPLVPGLPEPDLYPEIAFSVSLDPFPKATRLVPLSSLHDAYNYVRTKVVPGVEKLFPESSHL